MKFLFVNEYNKAFDFLILRYFAEKGIQVDQGLTFEKAISISKELEERGTRLERQLPPDGRVMRFKLCLAPHEVLFWDYVSAWGRHPEVHPATSYFLTRMFDDLFGLDSTKLEALEARLPPEHQKFFSSGREAAEQFLAFYRRYYMHQLKMEIKEGVGGRRLAEYLWHTEFEDRSDLDKSSIEKLDESYRKKALKVLAWSQKITGEAIFFDIMKVLEEHFRDTEHMEPTNPAHSDGYRYSCDHRSEYVRILGLRGASEKDQRVLLMPARGDHLVEEGWRDIAFPSYAVKVVEW